MRRRIKKILLGLEPARPVSDKLRTLRAIGVLERIGGPEAVRLLESFARPNPDHWLAKEAKRAASRMGEKEARRIE